MILIVINLWNCIYRRLKNSGLQCNSINCLISHSLFNIWNLTYTFLPHGLVRTHKWPAPNVSGFITQLVRVSHGYREVTGSNPIEVLTFSGFYIRNCISCFHNCEDHSLISHSQFNIWNISDISYFNMLTVSCELQNWEKNSHVCFYLSMNFIAWECNKVTWKLEPTWVDFMHSWFW